jgi:hypothetical protein
MLQPFPSFLGVSRSFAGRMRDETGVLRLHLSASAPGSISVAQAEGTL